MVLDSYITGVVAVAVSDTSILLLTLMIRRHIVVMFGVMITPGLWGVVFFVRVGYVSAG